MPKKTPKTATGGKRKRTPGDKTYPQHEEGEQADLETQDRDESRDKRKKSNALNISGTSALTLPQASTRKRSNEEGRLCLL